ncbi:hypothetical protein NX794_15835 [Streptomyces sp. LP11]|uniref:Uncharacterized protein n=1 Tax=Streptomyces pyxinicus TaxID=2970331 RepID=A0ABT2B3K7_9ACTN|nr:hypothetical protein [Streptomyces sp. LP11]MCS0602670.1 hypothetical protein [Streptomyces sp. LP11]
MTIKVYTVTREGVVTAPRAIVTVSRSYPPQPEQTTTALPPCACPLYRQTEAAR